MKTERGESSNVFFGHKIFQKSTAPHPIANTANKRPQGFQKNKQKYKNSIAVSLLTITTVKVRRKNGSPDDDDTLALSRHWEPAVSGISFAIF